MDASSGTSARTSANTASTAGSRRVFIELHELAGVSTGVWTGNPRALRRVLGARRGGRYGALGAGLGLLLAAPPRSWLLLTAAHVLLSLAALPLQRLRALTAVQHQRLLLWWVGPALLLAALARALGAPPLPTALVALVVAHAGHARNLLTGFEASGEAAEGPRD